MRFSLVLSSAALMLLAGCSSLFQKSGLFEDKSQTYVQAESLKEPLTVGVGAGAGYVQEILYPLPELSQIKPGQLFAKPPRVTSAFMSLEQNAILLHKNGEFDRVLFAELYVDNLASGISDYLKQRNLRVNYGQHIDAVEDLTQVLGESPFVKSEFKHIFLTQWASADHLGYDNPSFFRRLFGADRVQHQYVYYVSIPNDRHSKQSLEDYVVQLHVAHRTRTATGKKQTPWNLSIVDDEVLSAEILRFIEDLKQKTALTSSEVHRDMTILSQQDGNGLPYLSMSERFPVVWEVLLDILPLKNWKIADLNRSKGVMYLEVTNDSALDKVKIKKFQLSLTEGPRAVILSVELDDEQPAEFVVSQHVLEVIEKKFQEKIEDK